MNILLLSDTHGELGRTEEILRMHPLMDAYIHLGDVGFPLRNLSDFHIVKGNHDKNLRLPYEEIISLGERRVLCLHGNMFDEETVQEVLSRTENFNGDMMEVFMSTLYGKLVKYAVEKKCDTVFFGHTHHQCFERINDVVLINPGSVFLGTPQCGYAVVQIEGKAIQACFHDCEGLLRNDEISNIK